MKVSSQQLTIRHLLGGKSPLTNLKDAVDLAFGPGVTPLRVAVTGKTRAGHLCEIEAVEPKVHNASNEEVSVFDFRPRRHARTNAFNAVMLIPTGVDCAIGGHAGDATPAARLLARVCDQLVLHPNVVNASDVNEQTENCLYVEGSVICRLLMGTAGLRKIRQNRVLLVTEERPDAPNVVDNTINCAEGARATLGMDISEVVVLEKELFMQTGVSDSGRVTGRVERLGHLLDLLHEKRGSYDAVALATRITPHIDTVELHRSYFGEGGPNPWGGVEAILTHLTSSVLDVPSAHAPTMSSEALRTESWGVVEPRKAAEIISTTYLFCVLKGLNRAPQVVVNPSGVYDPSIITAEDVSCLVIPDGCVGLPTLAAVEQGIPVVAVRNNTNLMRNDLRALPFRPGQLQYAANYYEAAGILTAMKAGVAPATLERPMRPLRIERVAAPVVVETKVSRNGNGRGKSITANGHANGHHGNGQSNGHANGTAKNGHAIGNGHANGTAKGRRTKPITVIVENGQAASDLLTELGGE
ncbi:MAG: DUF3326 domain-containing protein [Planctomycetes bacterium]|nr:DUF3326 domain-containing protein [Planctomycetota bacterium]